MKVNVDIRSRLELHLDDAQNKVARAEADLLRCLDKNLAWTHPNVVTHRARLLAARAECDLIVRLLGDES